MRVSKSIQPTGQWLLYCFILSQVIGFTAAFQSSSTVWLTTRPTSCCSNNIGNTMNNCQMTSSKLHSLRLRHSSRSSSSSSSSSFTSSPTAIYASTRDDSYCNKSNDDSNKNKSSSINSKSYIRNVTDNHNNNNSISSTKSTIKRWLNTHKRNIIVTVVTIGAACMLVPFSALATTTHVVTSAAAEETSSTYLAQLTQTGFYQAFSLVFLSEIGDKTFFIAGLLAMKTSRFISFVGSMGALIVMTLISVLIGQIFHAVPSGFADGLPLDDIAAVLAFAFFGIKTLREALAMDSKDPAKGGGGSSMDDELAEAQETVEGQPIQVGFWGNVASIFALVFAAEFGDRSFLSTIALSAAQNPISVGFGAIAAHAVATGIAVSGGSIVAKYISERVIGLTSGTLFLVFAVTTALGIF